MKSDVLQKLAKFEQDLRALKKQIKTLETRQVGKKAIRDEAHRLANYWLENLHPALRNVFKLSDTLLDETTQNMNKLFVLSRPNNLASSYLKVIDEVLGGYKDKFVLPIQQMDVTVKDIPQLSNLLSDLDNLDETNYIKEAINCAQSGFYRAAIVMGWCAVIDRFHRKIQSVGFDKFHKASLRAKGLTSGKFKHWNKEFNISTLSELQTIFDYDLIVVFEGGLELIDLNEAKRLETLFNYRNQSAHPGNAPIDEPHLVAFFHDIIKIVFTNPSFKV